MTLTTLVWTITAPGCGDSGVTDSATVTRTADTVRADANADAVLATDSSWLTDSEGEHIADDADSGLSQDATPLDAAGDDAIADVSGDAVADVSGDAVADVSGDAIADVSGDAVADVSGDDDGGEVELDPVRAVVIARPFDAAAAASNRFVIWRLDADGTLTPTDSDFELGRAPWGRIHFTPDGRVGMVVQVDGTVGVFRVDPGLTSPVPTVVHAAFADGFYADALDIDPTGSHALIVDGNWPNNGGGIYRVNVAADGTLSGTTKLVETKLARGLVRLGGADRRAVVAAAELDGDASGDTHLISLTAPVTLIGSAVAFPQGDASVSAMGLTADGRFVVIAENSVWSGVPNRVAVVEIAGDALIPRQVLTPFSDPTDVVMSPWDNAALLLAADGSDAIYRLVYDAADPSAPFSLLGEVAYTDQAPALPSGAGLISRGALRGRVLVTENTAIRQLQLAADGTVTDLGVVPSGAGYDKINGALGVQP